MKKNYAIIDVGSNTIRLVIYQIDQIGRFKEIQNVKVVARLRNYLNSQSQLSPEGITVLINTLTSFREVIASYPVAKIKCVATATVRQSTNQREIMQQVKDKTDLDFRVISEYEEAFFGFLAVVNSTPFEEGITIDIGGGSTEITYFNQREIKEFHSFPFGVLSLKQMFVAGELPTETELAKISFFLKQQFSSLSWLNNKQLPIIAIGGSARNVVQIDQAIKKYPLAGVHQYKMKRDDLSSVKSYLQGKTVEQLERVEGLSSDRVDVIIPASEVFLSLYDCVNATSFCLSRKGLRDGVFYEELMRTFQISVFPNVLEESFHELAEEYEIDVNHSFHIAHTAKTMMEELEKLSLMSFSDDDYFYINKASYVYNLGQYIDSESSSQHSFYLLANRTIDGMLHKQRLTIALLASFKNKATFKQYLHPFRLWFTREEQKKLRILGLY
ncbi:Ppx/GppA phosphatase family protein [Bacillus carboniphilus]|uniref:Ppx/GppA phosphatase family protein n=1 Tax=Bacillus carboniphilus TaxID=86663 RepID=UPI003531C36F